MKISIDKKKLDKSSAAARLPVEDAKSLAMAPRLSAAAEVSSANSLLSQGLVNSRQVANGEEISRPAAAYSSSVELFPEEEAPTAAAKSSTVGSQFVSKFIELSRRSRRINLDLKTLMFIGGLSLIIIPAITLLKSPSKIPWTIAAHPTPVLKKPLTKEQKRRILLSKTPAEEYQGIENFERLGLNRANPTISFIERHLCRGRRVSKGCSGKVYHPYLYWWENNVDNWDLSPEDRGTAYRVILDTFRKKDISSRVKGGENIGNTVLHGFHNY